MKLKTISALIMCGCFLWGCEPGLLMVPEQDMFGPENPSLNAEDGAPEEYLVDEFELSGCGVDESLEDVLGEEPWADEVRGGDGGGAARAPSLPGGLGPQRVLTLLLEAGGRRFSAAELAAIPHTVYGAQADEGVALPPYSVNEAFAADSYGQTTIVGIDGEPGDADDVFGPFQVDDYRCSSPMSAVNEALERYEDAFDPAVFADGARLLLIMRQNTETCRYGGVATGGTMRSPDLPEGLLHMRLAVALYPGHRVIAHELGHIMGMGHTGITQCSGAAWGDIPYRNNTNAYYGDATCGSRTYADWMGFMGLGGASFMSHSGAIAKEAWGWLREDEDATHHIAPVNESGLYALKSISHTDVAGTKALKIPHGPNQFMYVEYRRAMEHDGTPTIDKNVAESAFYEESDIFSGALLRIGGGNGMYRRSLLFDAYASEDDLDLRTSSRLLNLSLPYTETYTDPLTGTRISLGVPVLSEDLDIDIELGRTDFAPPWILRFAVDQAASSDCAIVVRGEVEDPAGISRLVLHLENKNVEPTITQDVFLSPQNGTFEYHIDAQRFNGGSVKLTVEDAAQEQGGIVDNNVIIRALNLPNRSAQEECFVRGDVNRDGNIDLSDVTSITNTLFVADTSYFACEDAADVNDDGQINIADASYLAGYLFQGSVETLPEPFSAIGLDPTSDAISCEK